MTSDETASRALTSSNVQIAASLLRRVALNPHKVHWVESMPREVRECLLALGLRVQAEEEWRISL